MPMWWHRKKKGNMYTIETRTAEGWFPLHYDVKTEKMITYHTLQEATQELERHLDRLFFFNKAKVPYACFRIAKIKQ